MLLVAPRPKAPPAVPGPGPCESQMVEKLLKLLKPLSIVPPEPKCELNEILNAIVNAKKLLKIASQTQENLMPTVKDLIVSPKSKLMPCRTWGSTRPCLSTPS